VDILRKISCIICKYDFVPNARYHHNTGVCLNCKVKAAQLRRERYNKTDKGKRAKEKWLKSDRCKQNQKRYRQKPRARALAVIRTREHLKRCVECQKKKSIRDKQYAKSKIGRLNNNKAKRKYRQTEKGKWQAKTYKYYLRNNISGKIDKNAWELKLKELEGKCQICGATEMITIDHKIPLSKGGTNLIDNLQPLCRSCNCSKNKYLDTELLRNLHTLNHDNKL